MTTFHELCVEIQKVLASGGPLDDEQDAAYEVMGVLERLGIIPDNDGGGDDEVFGGVPEGLIEHLEADADEWERLGRSFIDSAFGPESTIRAANARAAAEALRHPLPFDVTVLPEMSSRSILLLTGDFDGELLDALSQAVLDHWVGILEDDGHVDSIAGKVPLIVALGGGQSLEVLDEVEMRKAGWVRVPPEAEQWKGGD